MSTPPNPLVPNDVPTNVNIGDFGKQEIDPKIFSELWHAGTDASGLLPKWIVQIVTGIIQCIKLAIGLYIEILDGVLSLLADYFQAAQGNSNPAFYALVAKLLTDLTGIDVDGGRLITDFQKRGRLAAMQEIGGSLVDALTSEFAGVFQSDQGGVFTTARGAGIAGLPDVQLSPEQGMNAARAFMGFALSFAVREGNTDFFADSLPFGIGHAFKDITEDMSKNIGLGRLVRLAMKPIFQNLIATPMTWAFNKQYRPTLLGIGETIRAFNNGLFSGEQLVEELSRHGLSTERQNALQAFHTKYPAEHDLFLLELGNKLPHSEHINVLRRIGYNDETAQQLFDAEGLHLKRQLSMRLAETLVHPLLLGTIDLAAYESVLNRFTLTDQEKQDLVGFASELLSHPRKRLTFAQITAAFVDGIVAVDQVAEFLHTEGYREDDISILLQLDLFKLKAAHAKAAAAAAKAAGKKKPPAPTTPPTGG